MPDLLVKLYELPPLEAALASARDNDYEIRRVMAPERSVVVDWVAGNFSRPWADECRVATSRHPLSCFVAVADGSIAGFSGYNATFPGFFGPVGVGEAHRGKGLGRALTLASLHALHAEGFAYGIIGGAKAIDYFQEIAGATEIENSTPGAYRGLVR